MEMKTEEKDVLDGKSLSLRPVRFSLQLVGCLAPFYTAREPASSAATGCTYKDERSVGLEKIDANCETIRSESEFKRTRKSCSSQGHTVTVTMFPLSINAGRVFPSDK